MLHSRNLVEMKHSSTFSITIKVIKKTARIQPKGLQPLKIAVFLNITHDSLKVLPVQSLQYGLVLQVGKKRGHGRTTIYAV
jgi:hypothetical protein